jgi:kynureninase
MDDLLAYRREFPALERTVYMISHSLGAMPRGVYDRLREFADVWATRGIQAWSDGWWEMPVTTGNKVAQIIGAAPGTVVMHQNVSICQSIILSCFDLTHRRNKVVYEALNFPSVMYVYEAHVRAAGGRLIEVPSDDGITIDIERLVDAIDEETLLVPISHVLFKTAYIQDVQAVVRKAHSVGAKVILDVYQSAGTVPFSVRDLDVDFAVGGSVKWLCGGPGAGYLYVNPALHRVLEPKITGWMAHHAPFDFETGQITYAPGIHRFLHGSPAIPSLYAGESGYDMINSIGVDKIRSKSVRQTARLIALADQHGWRVNSPRAQSQRGGTVVVDIPHAAAVVQELAGRNVLVDFRPGVGIRIAPHFYTADDELDAVMNEIEDILKSEAYRRHLSGGGARF